MKLVIKPPSTKNIIIDDRKVIEVENISQAAQFYADEGVFFDIAADSKSAFSAAFTARSFNVNLFTENEKVNFRSKKTKKLTKVISHCKLAHGLRQSRKAAEMLTEELTRLVPSQMSLEDALAIITDTIGKKTGQITAAAFLKKIKERDAIFLSHVSISPDADVERTDMSYGPDLIDFMIKTPDTIHILNGGMGVGKTSLVMLPMFEILCDNDSVPVFSTPRRSLAAAILNDERHYLNSRSNQSKAKGVIGVVNSLFGGVFEKLVTRSTAVLIDEFELHESHITSNAVGQGTLKERSELAKNVYEHIRASRYVVLADAMFSNFSIDKLIKETGKKVYVHSGTAQQKYKKITVCKEAENMTSVIEALQAGKKVALFSDASHNSDRSKFNEIHRAVSKYAEAIKIDSSTSKNSAQNFFGNITEKVKHTPAAVISPVISSGVSLLGHFNQVNYMGYETVDPLQLVQSLARVRDASDIFISIRQSRRNYPEVKSIVLGNEVQKEKAGSKLTSKTLKEYEKNKSIDFIIERIVYENELMSEYANATIVILKHLGFKVVYQENSKSESVGQQALKYGKKSEAEARAKGIKKTHSPIKNQTPELRENEAENNKKYTAAAHKMSIFYGEDIDKISDELINFDNNGKGRRLVINHKALISEVSEKDTADKVLNNLFIRKVAEFINIEESRYTTSQAQQLYQFISSGFIRLGDRQISARSILKTAFPSVTLGKQPGALVRNILKQGFGLEVEQGKRIRTQTSRERTYIIVETNKSRTAKNYASKQAEGQGGPHSPSSLQL